MINQKLQEKSLTSLPTVQSADTLVLPYQSTASQKITKSWTLRIKLRETIFCSPSYLRASVDSMQATSSMLSVRPSNCVKGEIDPISNRSPPECCRKSASSEKVNCVAPAGNPSRKIFPRSSSLDFIVLQSWNGGKFKFQIVCAVRVSPDCSADVKTRGREGKIEFNLSEAQRRRILILKKAKWNPTRFSRTRTQREQERAVVKFRLGVERISKTLFSSPKNRFSVLRRRLSVGAGKSGQMRVNRSMCEAS